MASPTQSKIDIFLFRSCCQAYLLKVFPEETQQRSSAAGYTTLKSDCMRKREDLFVLCVDFHYCDHLSIAPGFHDNSCLINDFTVMQNVVGVISNLRLGGQIQKDLCGC